MKKAQSNSRVTNSLYNFISSLGGQFLTIVMQFAVRTVFIATLGKSYLGISGLFSNILSMLSLAEFGVGSAILFKLYDPIAKLDKHRIAVLMKFYKTVYRAIGVLVAVLGVCLIPFLPKLVKDYDKLVALNLNAVLIFLLYLLKSVASYFFFAYKSAIINANQKEYLNNFISYFFTIGAGIVQIIFLLIYPKFEVYVIIMVLQIIGQNFVSARMADKMYPYINEKTTEKISIAEAKDIFKDCGALFLYKLNGVILKATDNIVISAFCGLDMVAVYSNYYIFYTTLITFFNKIFNAIAHSLGNLHTTHDNDWEYKIFKTVNLITAMIAGTAGIGIFVVADECILTWLGTGWTFKQPFALLLGLEIYTAGIRAALTRYRNTMGLFQQAKFRPLAGVIINIIVSVVLVKSWGICGVLVGTIAADWLTFMWFDPIIIHKYGFENTHSVWGYYLKTIKNFLIVCFVGFLLKMLCSHVLVGYGWISVIIHSIFCVLAVSPILILLNLKTEEMEYVMAMLKRYTNKFTKKKKKNS